LRLEEFGDGFAGLTQNNRCLALHNAAILRTSAPIYASRLLAVRAVKFSKLKNKFNTKVENMIRRLLELLKFIKPRCPLLQHYVDDRAKYDFSTKPFEILCKSYRFDKYTRQLKNAPEWQHYKYYKKLEGADDAIKAFRNSWYDIVYRDYPSMGNIENEATYAHIKPTITVKRYMIIKRNFN